jgi:pimeloyl-ACP methyl ester carboxylesterase
MSSPDVLLVHGAWHGAWCWRPVIGRLSRAGVLAAAVDLPFTSFEDVILCGHSYGGRLVSAAASPLASVRHLVYVSVQLPNARQLSEYRRRPRVTSTAIPDLDTVRSKYYNACSEEDFRAAARKLRPMTSVPGGLPGLECRPWEKITSTYIVCTRDRAIDAAAQRLMAANTTYTADIPADHAAFFSAPDDLSRVLASIAVSGHP